MDTERISQKQYDTSSDEMYFLEMNPFSWIF